MARKTRDAKPYLTARTPIGMTQRGDGDPSTTRPDAPESGAEEKVGSRPAGSG
jgi:hypothetical protein